MAYCALAAKTNDEMKEEWDDLRRNNFTSSWGGNRYPPKAFTEAGVYMLMTVLNGDLAAQRHE